MKSLSNTLKKSSIGIICLFTVVLILSLSITGKYLINSSKLSLRNAMAFLRFEIVEENSSKSMEIFKGDLVNELFRVENPSLEDLTIVIKHKNEIYSEATDDRFLKVAEENEVKNIHLYDYVVLKNSLVNKDGEIYTVFLIKDLSVEKKLFLNMIYIFLSGLIITIVISGFIFNRLLKKVNKQLQLLENLNSNITLENLTIIKPINYFKEFDKIILSYEEML
ncbi:MAG: hypothetical protein ACRCZO_18530, partial [Cetobacterium sp.]